MNWEAVGAVGEILGALVVLLTLAYLARQIRQNTAAIRTQTYEAVMTGFNDLNVHIVSRPQVADLLMRGHFEPTSLGQSEAVQYSFLLRSYANQWLKLFRLYEAGALNAKEWEGFAAEAAQVFACPGGRLFRSENHLYSDLYQELDRRRREDFAATERLGQSLATEASEGGEAAGAELRTSPTSDAATG